jgi:hypothetical protein
MKNIDKYFCGICDFKCSVKRIYNKHLNSIYHKIAIGEEDITKYKDVTCSYCGEIMKSRTSLWRHKKICAKQYEFFDNQKNTNEVANEDNVNKDDTDEDDANEANVNEDDADEPDANVNEDVYENINKDFLIKEVLKQTKILQEAYLEQSKTIDLLRQENQRQNRLIEKSLPLIGNITNTTNITNVMNNNFNINVFLNEKCKDALNLSDFIKSLTIEIEDLDKTKSLGFSKGLSNIIIKNLRQLDIYRRPIHCSDPMKEIMYIKNDDIWSKDKDDKPIVKRAINAVARKQLEKVKDWEEHNNVWKCNEKGTSEYIHLVKQVTSNEDSDSNKIIKNLVREVTIDKSSQ